MPPQYATPRISSAWIVGLYALVIGVGVLAWNAHSGVTLDEGAHPLPPGQAVGAASDLPERAEGSGVDDPLQADLLEEAGRLAASPDESLGARLSESAPSSDGAVRERQERIRLGVGASLGGLRPFDDANPWNQVIADAPVDPLSDALIHSMGADKGLHPDFASGTWEGAAIGIPYVVVSSAQPMAPIEFVDFPDESDPGPYPVPSGAPIEGAPSETADRHVIVLDRDNWKLYELAHAFEIGGGWRAAGGAVWDLKSNAGRPAGWTSADAAGLPIFPGLVRYDEIEAGEIRHALRFTASQTRRAYVPPASHWASQNRSLLLPPMGMRVRLRRDFDITKFPREVQVILKCLQQYGMILADNGSDWFVTGAPDARWDDDALHTLRQVRGSDFEVIRMDGLVAD